MTRLLDSAGAAAKRPFWSPAAHAARRPLIAARARIKTALRRFLEAEGFAEVECAALQVSPGNETHLHGFATELMATDGTPSRRYLHTSPEFAMKKLLAAGEERIFEFARVFRNRERSALHHPEFTLLEWYRANQSYERLMADCATLLSVAAEAAGATTFRFRALEADPFAAPERLSVAAAIARHCRIDLLAALPEAGGYEMLAAEATRLGVRVAADDTWSDVFSKILADWIEPKLGIGRPTILCDYPASEAALARRKSDDPRFAERFELYVAGVELANCFGELTDPAEQRARFEADMAEKERIYGERYPLDEDFLAALAIMPPAAGGALGFDRLVMLATGASDIEDVIWTPVASASPSPLAGEGRGGGRERASTPCPSPSPDPSPQGGGVKRQTLRRPAELVAAGLAPPGRLADLARVAERYAVAITPTMAALIDGENPADPIARQFVPDIRELDHALDERSDPIGDHAHEAVPGLVHRYPDRVLLKLSNVCPVYCRFCFRRETVGQGGPAQLSDAALDGALAYVAGRPEIWEVIVSGGDPLALSPRRLAAVAERIAAIGHVKVLRWHTRVPLVAPERVDAAMVAALKVPRLATWLALHANHPREFTTAGRAALARLADAGIALVSQSVLLRGVNDDAETLAALLRAFVENRVKPYYLHQGDLAPGTAHLRTTLAEGQALMRALRGSLSGLAQPTYVLDIPGGNGKVPAGPAWIEAVGDGWRPACPAPPSRSGGMRES